MSTPALDQGSSRADLVRAYIDRIDRNDFPVELFADGFQFYVPKFGIGHGLADFMEMAAGFGSAYHNIAHVIDLVADCGSVVIVEGRTSGQDAAGNAWQGAKRPAAASAACSTSMPTD